MNLLGYKNSASKILRESVLFESRWLSLLSRCEVYNINRTCINTNQELSCAVKEATVLQLMSGKDLDQNALTWSELLVFIFFNFSILINCCSIAKREI